MSLDVSRRSQTAATEESRIRCLNFADARLAVLDFLLLMKNSSFHIVPLPTEIADAARRVINAGAADHALITVDSPGSSPCRHCLRWAQPGERVILFPYAAIPSGHPYCETGPIFVHANECAPYSATNEYPAEFRNGRVFRAYDSNFKIIDAKIVNGREPEVVIESLFQNPDTAFVDVRSVTHGCFTFRVQRA
jgi:Protein of unknown function (DUF1203)